MPKKLEKLNLDEFLKLKQEVFDFLSWMDETDENFSEKYKEKNAKESEKEESNNQEQMTKLEAEIALLEEKIQKKENQNKLIKPLKTKWYKKILDKIKNFLKLK